MGPQNQSNYGLDAHFLLQAFEHIETAIIVSTPNHKIVCLNKKAQRLFGYSNEESINKSVQFLYDDDTDAIPLDQLGLNHLIQAPSEEHYIINYKCRSGYKFKGQTSGGVIKAPDGKVMFFVEMVKDDSSRLSAEEAFSRLHTITSSRDLSFNQRVQAILELGAKHFGLPIGILAKINHNQCTIQQVIHPEETLEAGMTFELSMTYCSHVYHADDVKGFNHVSQSDIASHPCFLNFGLESYLGSPIFVDGERYGTLSFSSPQPTRPFIRQDIEIVRLFAGWIGHEIAREKDRQALADAQHKLEAFAGTNELG